MRGILFFMLVLLSARSGLAAALVQSVGVEFDRGLVYTLYSGKFNFGMAANARHLRFSEAQWVVSPRFFGTYDVYTMDKSTVFTGVDYRDDFGLRYDSRIGKTRTLALPIGIRALVADRLLASVWLNVAAIHERLVYNEAMDVRQFDPDGSYRSLMQFGGASLQYIF